jgi:hypothetical protein
VVFLVMNYFCQKSLGGVQSFMPRDLGLLSAPLKRHYHMYMIMYIAFNSQRIFLQTNKQNYFQNQYQPSTEQPADSRHAKGCPWPADIVATLF